MSPLLLPFQSAILPHMLSANEGHIVVVSSVQGKMAIPFRSAYTASKHALQAFFDCLRAELVNTNIKITTISPGYVNTNLSLNAVNPDGSKYGLMDPTTSSGMNPTAVAYEILYSIINGDEDVIMATLLPRIAILLRTMCPSLYFFLMRSRAKQTLKIERIENASNLASGDDVNK